MGEGLFGLSFVEILVAGFLAFLLIKPREYVVIGRWFGRMLNQFVRSDHWKALQLASRDLRNIPRTLMREAYQDVATLREMEQEIRRGIDPSYSSSLRVPPSRREPPGTMPDASTTPPATPPDDRTGAGDQND
jgi:hypothetical protein